MKKALLAVVGTLAGLAWLVSYRVTPEHVRALDVAAAAPAPDPATASPEASAPSPGPSAAPTASPTPRGSDGTFTGAAEPNFYGVVQVRVVVRGGRITDVQAVQLPSDRARSAYISEVAGPMLKSEVIQAQSARIDIISGATFTSEGYAQSVASALGQAHFGS